MPYARPQLTDSLRKLGLAPGMTVMLHASVRSVGRVYGGPDEIHLAVGDAVEPGGTVMMLAGCQEGFDDVGRGVYSAQEEAEILAHQPPFDPRVARAARDNGTLAEFFRSYPGAICSDSVMGRLCARGARAAWITAGQPLDYSFGRGSPLEKLCTAAGRVLLLGSDHDTVTLLHYAEHVADFPDKRVVRYQVPVVRDGKRVWVACEEFDTSDAGVHARWPARYFAQIVDEFIEHRRGTPACSVGKVGDADSVLLDAAGLVDFAIHAMVARATG